MNIKKRAIEKTVRKAVKTFPAVVITGPRQSGKTTLLKELFSKTHTYISLEKPDIRLRIKDDPQGFLSQLELPAVLDEIQYCPELLPYIKELIDENRKPGQWLLTGSQQFSLMKNVSESLAGRAAVLSLLPFSMLELYGNVNKYTDALNWPGKSSGNRKVYKNCFQNALLKGFYPEIALNKKVDRQLWISSYITTYLERDIRNITNIGDLNQFERFLVACAVRTGQVLNISDLARDIGISVPTAKRWISVLEASYQLFLLYPYYKNIGKRIVKSPKIYFIDTAICTYLLGLNDKKTIFGSPHSGSLFETIVINDILKRFYNCGQKPALYYLRSRDGLEIDLILDRNGKLDLFEIKQTMTITHKHIISMERIKNELKELVCSTSVISRTEEEFFIRKGIKVFNWISVLTN